MRNQVVVGGVVAVVLLAVMGYIGFQRYADQQYVDAVMVHVKNVSLRVSNASRFETEESKVTFKELFARLDEDVAETEKRILEVQTISPTERKAQADTIIEYLKASQELLRALGLKYRKGLDVKTAMDQYERRIRDFREDPSFNSYLLRATSRAQEEKELAIDEFQKASYGVADTLGPLVAARTKLSVWAPADALLETGTLEQLGNKNLTKARDEERKAVEQKQKAAAAAALGPEQLAREKNCLACHELDRKLVGPAYRAVAKRYAGVPGAADKLAAKVMGGGKGVWGEIPMPPNAVTREEAEKIVGWVLSLAAAMPPATPPASLRQH